MSFMKALHLMKYMGNWNQTQMKQKLALIVIIGGWLGISGVLFGAVYDKYGESIMMAVPILASVLILVLLVTNKGLDEWLESLGD